ncbi:MAG: hypothetical protein WAV31_06215 [Candidatus Moraniibacteriota bacterium]
MTKKHQAGGVEGSCPSCRLGEVENGKCNRCKLTIAQINEQLKRIEMTKEANSYKGVLIDILLTIRKELERVFLEFHERPGDIYALNYTFNETSITISCLLDLLGSFLFLPPDCSDEHMYISGVTEKRRKKKILGLENFLKKIPGIKMPHRPEKIDIWLREE